MDHQSSVTSSHYPISRIDMDNFYNDIKIANINIDDLNIRDLDNCLASEKNGLYATIKPDDFEKNRVIQRFH